MQKANWMGTWLLAALVCWPGHGFAELDQNFGASPCEAALQIVHEKIKTNKFITDRAARDYDRQTSGMFGEVLRRTPKNGHWVDAGAGEAKAQLEYLGLWTPPRYKMSSNFEDRAEKGFRATAVSAQLPETDFVESWQSQNIDPEVFKYLHGKYIEDIPSGIIQPADLITDMYGPLAYTDDFTKILKLYQSMLTENGELIFLTSLGYNKVVINGEYMDLEEWLARKYKDCGLRFRIRWDYFRQYQEYRVVSFAWKKKDMGRCELPKLRLVSMKAEAPPHRLFEVLP